MPVIQGVRNEKNFLGPTTAPPKPVRSTVPRRLRWRRALPGVSSPCRGAQGAWERGHSTGRSALLLQQRSIRNDRLSLGIKAAFPRQHVSHLLGASSVSPELFLPGRSAARNAGCASSRVRGKRLCEHQALLWMPPPDLPNLSPDRNGTLLFPGSVRPRVED